MNATQESLIIGLVVLVICGAAIFWLYSQVNYLNKKTSMLESVLVDLKMAVDSAFQEEDDAAMPILGGAGAREATLKAAPFAPATSEGAGAVVPEETFYSSVLEQAHEETEEGDENGLARVLEGLSEVPTAEGVSVEAGGVSVQPTSEVAGAQSIEYDTMTKADLTALAEKRGLRVKKSNSRNEIIGLLRRTESSASREPSVGDVPGGAAGGALFPTGSTLDGDFPVDLGQAGASLEEAVELEPTA